MHMPAHLCQDLPLAHDKRVQTARDAQQVVRRVAVPKQE
jgi:hypothetical protein